MDLFFRGSHTTNFVTCGFNRSYNQAADVPSSKVTCKSPRSPSRNCRIMLAFVSMTDSITIFPALFITAIEMLSLCTSIPIYLLLVIQGRSFLDGLRQAPKPCYENGVEWTGAETTVTRRTRLLVLVSRCILDALGGELGCE